MNYMIAKLRFLTGVHFGNGMLHDCVSTFRSDALFSALYIEAMKINRAQDLYEAVKQGYLRFSDGLPFVENQYLVPRPMIYVETDRKSHEEDRKKFKRITYLPVELLDAFLNGDFNGDENPMENFGKFQQQDRAAVKGREETMPYHVRNFYFGEKNGLYVIIAYAEEWIRILAEELLEMLSYTGLGGKKTSGLGKFSLLRGKENKELFARLEKENGRYMLLSAALPKEEEMEHALEGASYLLTKCSGFVASDAFADEQRKKKDLYMFAAGSCFKKKFTGDIYDAAEGGKHPVYRYGKPLFIGV